MPSLNDIAEIVYQEIADAGLHPGGEFWVSHGSLEATTLVGAIRFRYLMSTTKVLLDSDHDIIKAYLRVRKGHRVRA